MRSSRRSFIKRSIGPIQTPKTDLLNTSVHLIHAPFPSAFQRRSSVHSYHPLSGHFGSLDDRTLQSVVIAGHCRSRVDRYDGFKAGLSLALSPRAITT